MSRRAATAPIRNSAAAAGARLQQAIKDTIGVTARVLIRDPDSIERSVGKAKRIVDRRPRD